jgi:catechol 2,3-dioxygenase-like lactoylglutathione lyase family enzyme
MDIKLGRVLHLGILVASLDDAVKLYENELGMGPFEIGNGDFFSDKIVNGVRNAGLPIKSAIYHGNGFEVELIEPVGPCVSLPLMKGVMMDE